MLYITIFRINDYKRSIFPHPQQFRKSAIDLSNQSIFSSNIQATQKFFYLIQFYKMSNQPIYQEVKVESSADNHSNQYTRLLEQIKKDEIEMSQLQDNVLRNLKSFLQNSNQFSDSQKRELREKIVTQVAQRKQRKMFQEQLKIILKAQQQRRAQQRAQQQREQNDREQQRERRRAQQQREQKDRQQKQQKAIEDLLTQQKAIDDSLKQMQKTMKEKQEAEKQLRQGQRAINQGAQNRYRPNQNIPQQTKIVADRNALKVDHLQNYMVRKTPFTVSTYFNKFQDWLNQSQPTSVMQAVQQERISLLSRQQQQASYSSSFKSSAAQLQISQYSKSIGYSLSNNAQNANLGYVIVNKNLFHQQQLEELNNLSSVNRAVVISVNGSCKSSQCSSNSLGVLSTTHSTQSSTQSPVNGSFQWKVSNNRNVSNTQVQYAEKLGNAYNKQALLKKTIVPSQRQSKGNKPKNQCNYLDERLKSQPRNKTRTNKEPIFLFNILQKITTWLNKKE